MTTRQSFTQGPAMTAAMLLAVAVLPDAGMAAAPLEVSGIKNGSKVQWSQLAEGALPGRILPAESGSGGPRLEVENKEAVEKRYRLLTLVAPEVTGKAYALRVPVRYKGIEVRAYLETWNHLRMSEGSTQEQAFFTRTLGPSGPLAVINGSSDGWAERVLFFMSEGRRPTRVELNLCLPGKGSVELGSVEWIASADAMVAQAGLNRPSVRASLSVVLAISAGVVAALVVALVLARHWRRSIETRRILAADTEREP